MPLPNWLIDLGYPAKINIGEISLAGWVLIFDGPKGIIPQGKCQIGDTYLTEGNYLNVCDDTTYTEADRDIMLKRNYEDIIRNWLNYYGSFSRITKKIYRHQLSPAGLPSTKRHYIPHPTAKPLPLP